MRDDVLVDLVRGELLESQHRGSLIILDAHGEASVSLGEVASPMFPRSSNKPMQAVGLVEAGLDIEPELLALAAASHSGGPEHVAGVERLLQLHGRSTADLRCTISMPIGEPERRNYVRNGGEPARIVSDCSGKHAAFLATAVINGWALDAYLDASHPVQRACRSAVERLAGEPVAAVSVDGVYQGSAALVGGQMFDVSRIEILKGPQGTLYGQTTTAGAVNIISNQPGNTLQGNARVEYGRFNSWRAEAVYGNTGRMI